MGNNVEVQIETHVNIVCGHCPYSVEMYVDGPEGRHVNPDYLGLMALHLYVTHKIGARNPEIVTDDLGHQSRSCGHRECADEHGHIDECLHPEDA